MSKPSPEIEFQARARLAADERRLAARSSAATTRTPGDPHPDRITGSRRASQPLTAVWRQFWRHPSPWLTGGFLLGSIGWRVSVPAFDWTDLVVPAALVVLFPLIEWVIHVAILHWRPRRVAGVPVDSLLARKHRAHHADPRLLPLVFIPWQVELWLLPSYVVVALLAFPSHSAGASFLVGVGVLMLTYEWVHYLVHSDYRPRSAAFRSVWRNHRLHHYKNEHYWFTVTSAGTADRLFGTYPDAAEVATSPTVRRLHALEESRLS